MLQTNAENLSKSPSMNFNISRSDNIQSLGVSDNKTEFNLGQETLSIIDYIDANFPILKKNVFDWTVEDVKQWLKHIGLEVYAEVFESNDIVGKNLLEIQEDELKNELGMTSVGHRKNLLHSVGYLRKIYIENKGRRLSIIRNKLAQFYYKRRSLVNLNWKTKKVKSVCDVIEEEDDAAETNLKSLPEEHEINEKYKALKKEGFLNSPWEGKTRKSSQVSEEEKEKLPDLMVSSKKGYENMISPNIAPKNSKHSSSLDKSPLILEESKLECLHERILFFKKKLNKFFI